MRVLMIGGTGFLGIHVARQLVEAGHDVTVFHRGQTTAQLFDGIKSWIGDRQDLSNFTAEFKRIAPQVVLDMIPYVEAEAHAVIQTFGGLAERLVAISSQDVYRAYGLFIGLEQGSAITEPCNED